MLSSVLKRLIAILSSKFSRLSTGCKIACCNSENVSFNSKSRSRSVRILESTIFLISISRSAIKPTAFNESPPDKTKLAESFGSMFIHFCLNESSVFF